MDPRELEIDILELAAEADWVWYSSELAYAWRTAQDEAVSAYRAWCESPGRTGYALYRAAQDRADQAQDVLAETITSYEQKARTRSSSRPRPGVRGAC